MSRVFIGVSLPRQVQFNLWSRGRTESPGGQAGPDFQPSNDAFGLPGDQTTL